MNTCIRLVHVHPDHHTTQLHGGKWREPEQSVSSVKLLLLTMPNRYNQSSLEYIQQHSYSKYKPHVTTLKSQCKHFQRFNQVSVTQTLKQISSVFSSLNALYNHKLSTVSHAKAKWDCSVARKPPYLPSKNQMCPILNWCFSPLMLVLYISTVLHVCIMCFWVVLHEIRVQSVMKPNAMSDLQLHYS